MVLSISRERYRVSNQFYIHQLREPVLVLLTDPSVLALTDGDPDVLGATRGEALALAWDRLADVVLPTSGLLYSLPIKNNASPSTMVTKDTEHISLVFCECHEKVDQLGRGGL